MFPFILCLIILIIYVIFTPKIVEHYDDRIIDINLYDCATFCREINGCYGFAYDDRNNVCYPASKTIDYTKRGYLYSNVMSPENHIICNKIIPIISPSNNPSVSERKSNSSYTCTEKSKTPILYYIYDGKMKKIDTGQNLDYLTEVDKYGVRNYDWPKGKFIYKSKNIKILPENRVTDLSYYMRDTINKNYKKIRELIKPSHQVFSIYGINIDTN